MATIDPYPTTNPEPVRPQRNGFGVAALVLGIVGTFFAFIPIIGVIAWPIVIVGVVLGAVGLHQVMRGTASNKGVTITGLALSSFGLVLCFLWTVFFGSVIAHTPPSTSAPTGNGAAAAPAASGHVVRYEVTGPGKAMIDYTTDGHMDSSSTTQQLPWSETVHLEDGWTPVSLRVTNSFESTGALECKVIVDGKVVTDNHSAGGEISSVNCDATVK